jgi:hypothetical protein
MKKNSMILAFFIVIFVGSAHAYIDKILDLSLMSGQQIVLMFDAYEGYTEDFNKTNAIAIAAALKNIAQEYPDQKIDFSYEDPAVYEAGRLLKSSLLLLEPHLSTAKDQFLALLQIAKGNRPNFHVMAFKKPPHLTTFLAGDLTRALALFSESGWPTNLTLRSNDPRQGYMLALTHSQSWLLANQKSIRTRNLITASSLLNAKRISFEFDDQLTRRQKEKLASVFEEFKNTEDAQLDAFANFVSTRGTREVVTAADLNRSIFDLSNKVSINMVHEFISTMKSHFDVYSDGPIIDVLLTMFASKHPDIMVIILGNHLAIKLAKILDDLEVIKGSYDVPRPAEYITWVAKRNLMK